MFLNHTFHLLIKISAGQSYNVAAMLTSNSNIHSHPNNLPTVGLACVWFFHFDYVEFIIILLVQGLTSPSFPVIITEYLTNLKSVLNRILTRIQSQSSLYSPADEFWSLFQNTPAFVLLKLRGGKTYFLLC